MIANSPAAWSERALKSPTSHGAAMWSRAGQQERFAAVFAALHPRHGETLLDFGCGTGAFSERIPAGVHYTGYDWAGGMVTRARCEHPGGEFWKVLPDGPFDLVACVGPFNLPDGWSKEKTWETLDLLWGRCRRALAVCLYAGGDLDCLIYDEDEIPLIAPTREATTTIRRPRLNDILLLMERT